MAFGEGFDGSPGGGFGVSTGDSGGGLSVGNLGSGSGFGFGSSGSGLGLNPGNLGSGPGFGFGSSGSGLGLTYGGSGFGNTLGSSFGSGLGQVSSFSNFSLPSFGGLGLQPTGSLGLQAPAFSGQTGLGIQGNLSMDNMRPGWAQALDSRLGRLARTALGIMNPVAGAVVNAATSAGMGRTAEAMGQVVGGLTGNGLLGAGATIGTMAAQGQNVAAPLGNVAGGTLGSMFGGQVMGPVGALVGGQLGSQIGQSIATAPGTANTGGSMNSGFAAPQGSTGGLFGGANTGDLLAAGLTGLAGMYSANRAQRDAQSNVTALGAMFGPDSAYAQQLRQQLERRDAAAGRRSQYGPREVELQARLAELAARSAPAISNSNMQAQQAAAAQRNAQLNTLLSLGRQTGVFNWAGNQLGNMFGRTGSSPVSYAISTPASFMPAPTSSVNLGGIGLRPSGGLGLTSGSWRF